MLNTLSIEYILYACDDDYKLAEKLCKRLNGLRLCFSLDQLNRITVQRKLLAGENVGEIANELDMPYGSVWIIRKRMIDSGLIYYYGEDEDGEKQERSAK